MWKMKNPCKILVRKTKEKRPLSRSKSIMEGNTEMIKKKQDERVCTGFNWLRIGSTRRLLSTQ
jgi:hypothetical protein